MKLAVIMAPDERFGRKWSNYEFRFRDTTNDDARVQRFVTVLVRVSTQINGLCSGKNCWDTVNTVLTGIKTAARRWHSSGRLAGLPEDCDGALAKLIGCCGSMRATRSIQLRLPPTADDETNLRSVP
ncbi:MAG: hypothetical protein JOY90_29605 [Bradyrhizobium sp.]|nr:hypothetical protein [Bradyrhizobium sp.]